MFFFFNDTATTEIYTLSLHDALPIFDPRRSSSGLIRSRVPIETPPDVIKTSAPRIASSKRAARSSSVSRARPFQTGRSEEHTSELQSRQYLVCRLLLEKKNNRQALSL